MDTFLKILLALVFGGILGAEREHAGKAAGLRTYMLVTLASTTFTIVAKEAQVFFQSANYDPGRILGQVILGIGFIGAGIIIYHREHVRGLTTAAGLWIATAVGLLIGIELYVLAVVVTIISFIILAIFPLIEEKIERGRDH